MKQKTIARGIICNGLAAALAVVLGQPSVSPAEAGDYDVGAIHIADTWARATPKGASAAAGYMTVTNNGTTPDRLSCVSSDASAKCQIHSMTMENGVMKMRPVEGGLDVKPGESVMLKPAGVHMMFLDLKHPLEPGKTVAATLQFEKAGTVQVEFPIAAIGAPAPGAATGGGTMMQGGSMMQVKPQRSRTDAQERLQRTRAHRCNLSDCGPGFGPRQRLAIFRLTPALLRRRMAASAADRAICSQARGTAAAFLPAPACGRRRGSSTP
jgi:copper(I)-binding protein